MTTTTKEKKGLSTKMKAKKKDQKMWWKEAMKNVKKVDKPDQDMSKMTVKELQDMVNRNEDEPMSEVLQSKEFLPIFINNEWKSMDGEVIFEKNCDKFIEKPIDGSEPKLSAVKMFGEREQLLKKYKIFIAHHSRKVMVNPKLVDSFNALVDLLKENNYLISIAVRKLAALSLLRVFEDILPNYKLNKNLLNCKMYKEKLEVVKGEFGVLEFYRKYLKMMEANLYELKGQTNHLSRKSLKMALLKCLGELLVKYPTFNYAMNICELLVPFLNDTDESVRNFVRHYMKQLLETDERGITSLSVVQIVYKLTKRLRFQVKPQVIEIFLYLNISKMKNPDTIKKELREAEKSIKKNVGNITKLKNKQDLQSRKEKKENRKRAILKNKIADVEANTMLHQISKQHSEILKLVLAMYFNILKSHRKKLLATVFEGLSKFAHLINYEFFLDMLKHFNEYLDSGNLNLSDTLMCLESIFKIVNQQDNALGVDPTHFVHHVYRVMPRIARECTENNVKLLIQTLHQVLIERKIVLVQNRIMAFTKKLAMICCTLLPHPAQIPILVVLNSFMKKFHCNESLLEIDNEGLSRTFDASISDPNFSNSDAAALFELHLSRASYHPMVSKISKDILTKTTIDYQCHPKAAHKLFNEYSGMVFNPVIPDPKPLKSGRKRKYDELCMQDQTLQDTFIDYMNQSDNTGHKNLNVYKYLIENQDLDDIPSRTLLHEKVNFSAELLAKF